MRVMLGALTLLLVAACSSNNGAESSSGPSSPGTPSASPSSTPPPPPGPRLRAAQRVLTRSAGAAYTLRVANALTDPFISERGVFDVPAEVINLRRTVHLPQRGDRSRQVLRLRSSRTTRFLQLSDWGPWDGCWAEFDDAGFADLGIDLRDIPNIPIPVSLVTAARLSPDNVSSTSGAVAGKATVLTDGFTALQMLGFPTSVLLDLPLAVVRVKVPAHLTYFLEHPAVVESIDVEGGEVSEAFRTGQAKVPQELRQYLGYRSATATFAPADRPVTFERPPAKQLLPPNATGDQTCAAHQGPIQNITVENVVVSRNPTRS